MSIHRDILIIESDLKMPIMSLPIKMTLVRVGESVILVSPIPEISEYKSQIDEFGSVTDIVAPNLFHNMGAASAQNLFPDAKLWGAKGLREKLPQLNWHAELSLESWPYQKELSIFLIDGMPKMSEVPLLHRSSKTLIVADLCFNHVNGRGVGNWIIFNMFGTYKRFAVSKLFLKMVKDPEAFAASVKNLLKEDFENMLIPHGNNIVGNARSLLTDAMHERGII